MGKEEFKKELYNNVLDGDFESSKELAENALLEEVDPLSIINESLIPAIKLAGEKFGNGEYFLPDLMRSAKALQEAIDIFEVEIKKRGIKRETIGKIVIGTVKGDIHEIGKSIVSALLSVSGFEVIDLGFDVDANKFIDKIIEVNADILAMSALLPITIPYQGVVIEELKKRNLNDKIKVMVGGAPVTQEHCDKIGADGYASNAVEAAKLAEKLMKNK